MQLRDFPDQMKEGAVEKAVKFQPVRGGRYVRSV